MEGKKGHERRQKIKDEEVTGRLKRDGGGGGAG